MATQRTLKPLNHVLVIGGCGFLGQHIVALALEKKAASKLSVLDLHTNRNRHDGVTYVNGDITDYETVKNAFEKLRPDVVIHTAGPLFDSKRDILFKVNVTGTENLLKASQETGVKAFVYTSSASVVFDEGTQVVNASEKWPLVLGDDQPEYYTSTKGWGEVAVLDANRQTSSFLTCAIRPAGIFGEGDKQMIPNAIGVLRENRTRFQLGPNTNLFDFTYVRNVAWAHLLGASALLTSHSMLPTVPLDSERVDGEAFFVTNDSPVYFWDFIRTIWREAGHSEGLERVWVVPKEFALVLAAVFEWWVRIFGKGPALTRQRARYSCMMRYYCIDKAKQRLGYAPIVSLEEGIRRGVRDALEVEKETTEKKSQ